MTKKVSLKVSTSNRAKIRRAIDDDENIKDIAEKFGIKISLCASIYEAETLKIKRSAKRCKENKQKLPSFKDLNKIIDETLGNHTRAIDAMMARSSLRPENYRGREYDHFTK